MKRMGLWRVAALVVFGLIFLSFIFTVFAQDIYLVSSLSTRLILHILVIVSVIAYMLFTEKIYRAMKTPGAKNAFIYALVFTIPALLARGLEICVLFLSFKQPQVFLSLISICRVSEFVIWTIALPISLLMLLHIFESWMEKPLHILCGVAAFCSLMMLVCMFAYPHPVILWSLIGIWGAMYAGAVFIYIVKAIKNMLTQPESGGLEQ